MKRRLALILVVILTLTALFGLTAAASEEKATLNFYFWDESQKPAMAAIADGFMAENPNITVELTVIPFADYVTKLKTSLPSGTGPDVFWINKTVMDLQEYLEPIQDRVAASGIDTGNFVDAIVGMFTVDGNLYGIPKDVDAPVLFYNKKLFDAKEIPYPTNEWKWDDLKESAKQLSGDGVYGFAAQCSVYDGIFNYLPCFGAPIYDETATKFAANTPEGLKAVQFMLDLMYVDQSSPTEAEMTELSAGDMFKGELVAMIVNGSWMLSEYHNAFGADLGLAMVPYDTERVYQSNGLAFAMSATSSQKDQAWKFLEYCASPAAQEAQAIVVIPALEGTEAKWMETYPDLDLSAVPESLKFSIPMYFASKNMNACTDKLQEGFTNIWMQSVEPAAGLAEMERVIAELNQ